MSMRVLVTDGMDASAVEQLRKDGYEVVEQFYEPDALGAALREFDAVIIRSATKIKEPQIDAAKGSRLKLIIRAGVGVDNIAVKYAEEACITVKNTPRASSNAVAELAIALLFSCARNISIAGHTMRENKWEKKAYSKGFELAGKTAGVLGYGRIGQMVGAKCQALGMNVLSAVSLAKMKDGVVVINVSRGSNVDEAALLDALNSGKVRAAGLDVWMSEKDPNWALAQHPAVSCTPHIGAGTKEAQKRIGLELVDIIEHF